MDSPKKTPFFPPVLIDTPIWQEYFRKEEPIFSEVNLLMDAGRACCLGFIVAELLYGAETKEETKVFRDFMHIFPILKEKPGMEVWVEAAYLAFRLRRMGKKLSLRDSYIAVMAKSHEVLLYTTNETLCKVRRVIGLRIFSDGSLHK